jgi:hypothetical protein
MDGYIVTGVVAVIGLAIFYKPIARLIDRISGASKDGISFERPQDGGEAQPPLLPFVEIMKQPMSPTALEREKFVENQLKTIGLGTDAEKIAAMVRVFAITRIELEFNNIAHTIFGSQISLLIKISGTKSGVTKQEANAIFEEAQKTYPDLHGGRNFDEWFSFPINSNLVAFNEDRIDITSYGKDFLKHLVDTRQAHQRYG